MNKIYTCSLFAVAMGCLVSLAKAQSLPVQVQPGYEMVKDVSPESSREILNLWISSDLEPSYRKETNKLFLPRVRNLDGTFGAINETKLHPLTPSTYRAGKGPWAVKCEYKPDYSIEVHTAAIELSKNSWIGRLTLSGQYPHPTEHTQQWSVSGDGSINQRAQEESTLSSWILDADRPLGFTGTSSKPLTVPFHSVFTLNALTSIAPGVNLTNTYGVYWHAPVDWHTAIPGRKEWRSVAPVDPTGPFGIYQNFVGSFEYKTVKGGLVMVEETDEFEDDEIGWGNILTDVLMATADQFVAGAIEDVPNIYHRLALMFAKQSCDLYTGKVNEQISSTTSTSYETLWNTGKRNDITTCLWFDENGSPIARPDYDTSRIWGTPNPDRTLEALMEKWMCSDVKMYFPIDKYLLRGDAYDKNGYKGYVYDAVEDYDGSSVRFSATFRQTS